MHRYLLLSLLTLLLAACSAVDEPLPQETLEQLVGKWHQTDGTARLQVYADEQVKLIMPGGNPSRLVAPLEIIKGEQIGFSIGDRWSGPVEIAPYDNGQHFVLIFPGEDGRLLTFDRDAEQ